MDTITRTVDQIIIGDIIERGDEFHRIIDIYSHAGKTLFRCEGGWFIELEDGSRVASTFVAGFNVRVFTI